MTTPPDAPADDLVARLSSVCVDYDGSQIPDGAEPRVSLSCGDLRAASARIRSLEARLGTILQDECGSCVLTRANCADEMAEVEVGRRRAEAQRDEAVGLLRGFVETHEFRYGEGLEHTVPASISKTRAFLDSLKEGR